MIAVRYGPAVQNGDADAAVTADLHARFYFVGRLFDRLGFATQRIAYCDAVSEDSLMFLNVFCFVRPFDAQFFDSARCTARACSLKVYT